MEARELRSLLEDVDARAGDVLGAHRERLALIATTLEAAADEVSPERGRALAAAARLARESADRLEDRLRTDVLSEARERMSRELPPERRERIRDEVKEERRE